MASAPRVDAATRTWDGGGADNNWSTPANWSSDTLPIAGDTVTFNGTSTKNATIDVPVTVAIFQVNAGSLFPALRRLERDALIAGEWRVTENNRRAKYYALTTRGRAQLKRETRDWEVQTTAIARILKASLGEL